jgi:hypothetical protein
VTGLHIGSSESAKKHAAGVLMGEKDAFERAGSEACYSREC